MVTGIECRCLSLSYIPDFKTFFSYETVSWVGSDLQSPCFSLFKFLLKVEPHTSGEDAGTELFYQITGSGENTEESLS